MNKYRSHGAGQISVPDVGSQVTLAGWACAVRDHGGVIFVDLRDATGLAQMVFDPHDAPQPCARAKRLSVEDVVQITGTVTKRPAGTENPTLASGAVEVRASALTILNETAPLPFPLEEKIEASEETRLKYRYLDLRRPGGTRGLKIRHHAMQACRRYLSEQGFLEVETPQLWKSTPEGARDYLVPSRVHPGRFFALPQSPQLIKQTLMVAGIDRYFQIARCFRDEDLRADRQPEFSQIDVEMSFVTEEDVFTVVEDMMDRIFQSAGQVFPRPVPQLNFKDAILQYGTDKPDVRFDMKIADVTDVVKGCAVDLIRKAVERGEKVKTVALPAPAGEVTRSHLDELDAFAKSAGMPGLSWYQAGGSQASPLMKRLTEEERAAVSQEAGAAAGRWVFVSFDSSPRVEEFMGALRLHLGMRYKLIREGFSVLWVHEFPLFTWDEDRRGLVSTHHMFTAPYEEDLHLLDTHPGQARAHTYDLIINGVEILSGSLRIHRPEIQKKVFAISGYKPDVAEERFGFLLKALGHGAPPHGGFAVGLDRLVQLLGGFDSIRDTIAFPKTQRALCPLSGAPGSVDKAQLQELHLTMIEEETRGSKGQGEGG